MLSIQSTNLGTEDRRDYDVSVKKYCNDFFARLVGLGRGEAMWRCTVALVRGVRLILPPHNSV